MANGNETSPRRDTAAYWVGVVVAAVVATGSSTGLQMAVPIRSNAYTSEDAAKDQEINAAARKSLQKQIDGLRRDLEKEIVRAQAWQQQHTEFAAVQIERNEQRFDRLKDEVHKLEVRCCR